MADVTRRKFVKLVGGTAAGLAGTSALTQSASAKSTQSQQRKPNVVIIAMDQLRADQIHCFGQPRLTTPNIDRLAERGVRFSKFFTVASWTTPSFASLHTSLYASQHGVTLFWHSDMPLIPNNTPMLAPHFAYHGYYTTAFVGNGLAGRELTGRGFDEYYQFQGSRNDVNITQRTGHTDLYAPLMTEKILPWLDKRQDPAAQPFFLYVHFLEPHSPYNPPPEDDIFASGPYIHLHDTGYNIKDAPLKRLAMLGDQQAIERLYQLYDGKIHFVDRYVGKILDHLDKLGLTDNTLVAILSDHGELIYSHPEDFQTFDHRSCYDTDIHVPLILAGPGVPEGKVVESLACNIDVAPTLLEYAGLPAIPGASGESLLPLITGDREKVRDYVFCEEDVEVPLRAVRSMKSKLTRSLWTGAEKFFDLESDPQELHNIIDQNPPELKALRLQLDEWLKKYEPATRLQLRRWRIYTLPFKNLIVDEMTIGSQMMIEGGHWKSDTVPASENYNGGCFWTEGGNGSHYAIWRTDCPKLGDFDIYIYYGKPSIGKLATDAPFTVVTEQGESVTKIDFSHEPARWHLVGRYHDPLYVKLTNEANGAVIADAVKFLRVSLS